ncbi:MAG TPA: hypothetical protein VE673_09700 [Pseudonocardiaceae bacterium]|nr:hypothetical protein [Pseudonocardiaceae bacterium]
MLYFTGHGLKDDQARLYLAMTNTKRDDLLFTALSAQQIDEAMESCASRQKVLVLDCCYSGAFPAGRVSKADGQVQISGQGASGAHRFRLHTVFFRRKPRRRRRNAVGVHSFPGAGLTTGEADLDSDGDISIDELYSYVHDRVVEEMPQQRPKKQKNIEGRIVIT